jgi:hypothetical protein
MFLPPWTLETLAQNKLGLFKVPSVMSCCHVTGEKTEGEGEIMFCSSVSGLSCSNTCCWVVDSRVIIKHDVSSSKPRLDVTFALGAICLSSIIDEYYSSMLVGQLGR